MARPDGLTADIVLSQRRVVLAERTANLTLPQAAEGCRPRAATRRAGLENEEKI